MFSAIPPLALAFAGAGGAVLAWAAILAGAAHRSVRTLHLATAVHKHHWVQACAQITVLLYWGWHARFVYAFLPLIAAQIVFAYAVDSLLTWSRRDTYALGFGPFPVILSINLFLWFQPQWFHWQFAMIVLGYLGKELIRWPRDGRSAHVFNPSSFPLAVFALGLLLTGASDVTMGRAIATTQFYAPHIYVVIFLASLPGQVLFGVARMTLAAVGTLFTISELVRATTGAYLFFDSSVPVPVFLGMHLLLTDPSTSPRSEGGRVLFGMLYGLGVAVLYVILSGLGLPTFYDKLLPVPILNLCVRAIDRAMASPRAGGLDPARLWVSLGGRRRHVAYTALWCGVFLSLLAVDGFGRRHPGQALPTWWEACAAGSARACAYEASMTWIYCQNGSGWACNEAGVRLVDEDLIEAQGAFARACGLGFPAGCENSAALAEGGSARARQGPRLEDLPIVLRGTAPPLRDRTPDELYQLACAHGWPGACGSDGT